MQKPTNEEGLHYYTFQMPEQSEWSCYPFGKGTYFQIIPRRGEHPNRFHRFMQWLCFGFWWEKRS